MRDYREKKVPGIITNIRGLAMLPGYAEVTVRMTSDVIGQTLSLEADGTMITIPLEPVADILKVVDK